MPLRHVNAQSLVLLVKVIVIATWLAAAAAFLLPPDSTLGQAGRAFFLLLFAVHALECAVFFRSLRRTGRPLVLELANTLFFGIIHYTEVKAILESERGRGNGPT